jgi:hypothetical protein
LSEKNVTGGSKVLEEVVKGQGTSQVSKSQGDQKSGTLNGVLSTPSYLLELQLSHVPRVLTEISEMKQVRKFRTQDLVHFVFERFRSTLTKKTEYISSAGSVIARPLDLELAD